MVYVNQDAPPGVRMKSDPTSAAIGELQADRSMEQVHTKLIEGGVPGDRIHFLSGDGGVEFLSDVGNWLSRLISQTWQDANDALADGKVLVGVFEVDEVDASRIHLLLREAGVDRIRSFGAWTWT